jgi:hypothetical protein
MYRDICEKMSGIGENEERAVVTDMLEGLHAKWYLL